MNTAFETEAYEEVRQAILAKNWKQAESLLEDLDYDTGESEESAFLGFLLQHWTRLTRTSAGPRTCYYLTGHNPKLVSGLTEVQARSIADYLFKIADDADQFSSGYAWALRAFPDSDDLLMALIEGGVDESYYCEDAFRDAAVSRSAARNNMLHALEPLSMFNYNCTEGGMSAAEALKYFLRDIKSIAESRSSFAEVHIRRAIAFVGEKWRTPASEAEWEAIRRQLSRVSRK